jgi:hypothetical protein
LLLIVLLAGGAAAQTGSVTFEDQTSGGNAVNVAEVTVPDNGFVAIHNGSVADGDVLGSVVGVTGKLSAGTHEDVTAHLWDDLDEDQPLVAMPHKDTDDNGVYSFVADNGQTDGPYTDGGQPVTDAAQVTISATVKGDDQPTDGEHVLVDRVVMEEGGFVAVHNDRLLEGMAVASVVGSSDFLSEGVHENVRIQLDEELTENQTLILMPHRDSNENGEYDFVNSAGQDDPPYTNHTGQAVIDPAQVNVSDEAQASLADQTTGGHVLDVEEVFVPEAGFVTIHDSSLIEGATFESIRGSSAYLGPGLHGNVEVLLDKPLEDDDTVYAMPHKDTNGNQQYDFKTSDGGADGPYTADGGAVTDPGDAHVSASTHFEPGESDGLKVLVDRVDLSEGGFVTIHDASLLEGAVFASVAGVSAKLDAGVHRDVEVKLDEPVPSSQPLVSMPHKDTNGNADYDFVTDQGADDGPYADSQGSPVVAPAFTAIRSTVHAEDQAVDDGSVTIKSATLTDGGFMTVHDSRLLEGKPLESVVGITEYLNAGTSEDLEIELDKGVESAETLYGMPHHDSDGDQTYDFVDSMGQDDPPYTASGGAVLAPFQANPSSDGGGMDDGGSDDGGTNGMPAPGVAAALAAAGLAAVARRRR